jgi:23S rRNA (cytidine1920-2'-O)/16S rRNA (cytidine1409-2'-O)-methyltransferase
LNTSKQKIKKKIIDILLERNLVPSTNIAKALILEGRVKIEGAVVDKQGLMVDSKSNIEIIEKSPYVSRGGLKLEKAIEEFKLEVEGKNAIDVGASTGGFTDFLIKSGIKKVVAVDVGYGQLSWNLRQSPKVIVLDRTNIRYLDVKKLPFLAGLTVVDVSFISIKTIFSKILDITEENGQILLLVKPQFEVGKDEVEKGGVIKNENLHLKVLKGIVKFIDSFDIEIIDLTFSKIKGARGNIEYWVYIRKIYKKSKINNKKTISNYDKIITKVVEQSHNYFAVI